MNFENEVPKKFSSPLEESLARLEKTLESQADRWQELFKDKDWEGSLDTYEDEVVLLHFPSQTRSETSLSTPLDTRVFWINTDEICTDAAWLPQHRAMIEKILPKE